MIPTNLPATSARCAIRRWASKDNSGSPQPACYCAAAVRWDRCWPARWCGPASAGCEWWIATFWKPATCSGQSLFDEQDVAEGLPKAIAATGKLRRINSRVQIEPIVADVDWQNIEQLAAGVDLILDGTDNFETRYLINDLAVRESIPWVFGGVIGAEGQTMTILPGDTACLRCLMSEAPPPGSTPTCDTAGILGPIVGLIASIQALEAIKILSGNRQAISRR